MAKLFFRSGFFAMMFFVLLGSNAFAADKVTLRNHIPAAVARLHAKGRVAADKKLNLSIGLPLRNEAALDAFIESVQDPASPNYRKFLSPEEFTERFGPTKADYEAVKDFAKAHHLRVTHEHGNRAVLSVEGDAADIEDAFGVKLQVFSHPTENRTFFSPDTDPTVDRGVPILHVTGLNNYSLPHPKFHPNGNMAPAATPHTGSGPGGAYWGNDFRNAYLPGVTLTGKGQSVALLQFDGFYANDITRYANNSGIPRIPLTVVPVDGGVTTPSDGNGEVCLDIEMVMAMAPGLSRIYVYEAPNPSPWPDLLSKIANDNFAKQIGCSWGGGGPDPTCEVIFKQMAAQGQTFFNASGDNDAFTGSVEFPSESTNIVQVGGTTLTTSSGNYVSETVWNWGGGTGSSGGVSTTYPLPSYQQGISMTKSGGSTTRRNIPDVALTADNVYVTYNNGVSDVFGGTSCAAPLWAGLTALINQQATANSRPPVGFINPAIYTLGKSPLYTSVFHDITTGNNTSSSSPNSYYAVAGYDLCTGWGTPKGSAFIDAIAGPSDALVVTPATGFSSSGGIGGPFDVTTQTFTLTNSGTTALTWQATANASWISFSSMSGSLVSGNTTAVNVSINANANTLPAGTYTATVGFTNVSTGISQNREVTLTVLGAPVFTLQPESQTANQGETVTFTSAAIGYAPLNYQWTWNSNPISGATTTSLTLNGATTHNSGTYNLVVSNPIGTTTSSNAVLIVYGGAPNDLCSDAIQITSDTYTNVQSTTLATSTGDPSPSCAAEFGKGVWYSWTAPADGLVSVDTMGSSFDTVMAAYIGNCGSLTRLDCDDDSGGSLTSQITHAVTAGVTYHYLAGGYASASGQLVFHLRVLHPLTITTQPQDAPATVGANAIFDVAAAGGIAPYKYQWFSTRDGGTTVTKLVGQTNGTFILQRAAKTLPPYYFVVVSDSASKPNVVTSQVAKVVVYTAPRITVQPLSQTKIAGNNVAFRVTATGTAPLSYQWNLEGNPITDATNTLLLCTNVQSADAGHYQCVVNGPYGSSAMTGLMRGNLVVKPDIDYPRIAITKPVRGSIFTAGLRVLGETNLAPDLDIYGRATDFGLITNVTITRTFPTNAMLTNIATLSGTTPNSKAFVSHVTLVPGVNTFTATATDSAGHTTKSLPANYTLKVK
jgi:hypothetical protein